MTTTALFIRHKTLPGLREQVRALWMTHMAPAIQANPGHVHYVYSFEKDDPDGICAFQVYASAREAQAFLEHHAYRAYLTAVDGLLAGRPTVVTLAPQWQKAVDAC